MVCHRAGFRFAEKLRPTCAKCNSGTLDATTGAEALFILKALRGAEAPLFHGCVRIF
jgi:hypothetical protein